MSKKVLNLSLWKQADTKTEELKMKNDNKRTYSKENYLRNGTKTQNQYAKNSFNNNVQEPALNESGEEAKRRGF